MNNRNIIRSMSQEFNKQLNSTGHFGTFTSKNLYNNNHLFFPTDNNKFNLYSKYEKIFSETNPKKNREIFFNNRSNFSFNNLKLNPDESSNLSIENIRLLPNYFLDIEEALKKSNNNVLELKETVKEKIKQEKKLKIIIEQLKTDYNKLLKDNEKLKIENIKLSEANEELNIKNNKYEKITEELNEKISNYEKNNKELNEKISNYEKNNKELNEKISNYKKNNKELNEKISNYEKNNKELNEKIKNDEKKIKDLNEKINKYEKNIKKYQNANGILENEINNLGEDIHDGVKILQKQLKKVQEENFDLITLNKKLSDENLKNINEIKQLKIKIKNHLHEKMNFLEMNNLNKKQKIVNNKLNNIINYNKTQLKSLSKENDKLRDIQKDYKYLSDNYKKICEDNSAYKEKMRKKDDVEKKLIELKERYDKEKFENICQINLWKKNFLTITKYRLLNYSPELGHNVDIIKFEQKYIDNAPTSLKKLSEKILEYFKELIDHEYNNKTKNNKDYKNINEMKDYKEKISSLNDKLNEEKKLRRKIFYNYLNLRGNISVVCRLKPYSQDEKINKNSQIDTFIIDNNTLIVKNKENNNLKKYEFDYIFPGEYTQHDIYKEVFPLIHSLFKGDNVIILSYGQKNSGKSYTILGENNDKGIIGRAMQEIFYILNDENKDKYSEYNISMNIININNNGIFNLLEETTPQLNAKENSKGELLIEDLISINIKSFEECDKLFKLSKKFHDYKNNGSENNILNYIYSFNIKLIEKEGNIIKSNLIFIDLGNKNKDEEYKDINYDIDEHNNLYNLLICLSHNKIDEYKDWNKSLLVHYLKKYINEKRYKLMLFLNVSQDTKELEQTFKTLKFGEGIISDNFNK